MVASRCYETQIRLQLSKRQRTVVRFYACVLLGAPAAMSGGLILTSEGDVGSGDSGGGAPMCRPSVCLCSSGCPSLGPPGVKRWPAEAGLPPHLPVIHAGCLRTYSGVAGPYRWTRDVEGPASTSVAFDCSLADRHSDLKMRLK